MPWNKLENPGKGRPRGGTFVTVMEKKRMYLAAGLGYKRKDRLDLLINEDKSKFALTVGSDKGQFVVTKTGKTGLAVFAGKLVEDFGLVPGERLEGTLEGKRWVFSVNVKK